MVKKLALILMLICCAVEAKADVGIEALYWKPMATPAILGNSARQIPNVQIEAKIFQLPADISWGVRAFASYKRCEYEAKLSYIWYQSVNRAVRRSPIADLVPANQLAVPATTRIEGLHVLSYQNLDIRIGENIFCVPAYRLQFFVNGGYLVLERYHRAQGLNTTGTNFSQWVTFDAYRGGLVGFGIRFDADIWCRLLGFAEFNPAMSIAQRRDRRNSLQPAPAQIKVLVGPTVAINPALSARVGLRWTYQWCGCGIEAQVGYQMDYFWHVFTQEFTNTDARTHADSVSVGFAGPFAGLQGRF